MRARGTGEGRERAASEGEGTGASGVSVALVEGPGLPGGSRRWPGALGRAPRLASAFWQRWEMTGNGASGLALYSGGRASLVAAQVRPGK